MKTTLMVEETGRTESHSVLCVSGLMQRLIDLPQLPRRGDRTRFVIRDESAEAVYRVEWRRSGIGRYPIIWLSLVVAVGSPAAIDWLLVRAGFRPDERIARRIETATDMLKRIDVESIDGVPVEVLRVDRAESDVTW